MSFPHRFLTPRPPPAIFAARGRDEEGGTGNSFANRFYVTMSSPRPLQFPAALSSAFPTVWRMYQMDSVYRWTVLPPLPMDAAPFLHLADRAMAIVLRAWLTRLTRLQWLNWPLKRG
jgi:hypothetical protein